METKKLYYLDPLMHEFSATVLSCEEAKGGYAIALDQTAFYPEGGGQPSDHGVLGGVNVLDVHEKNGVITHLCDAPLSVGAKVQGTLNWARRFDHMQQHSGEHICSGLICEKYLCDNVGFHMGTDVTTIDFNADISWDELLEIEARANQYIYENHAIDIHFYRGAELDAVEYRSKKPLEGDVRIVSFPGADCCACCGTHVVQSGQVGIVKFLSCQKFRSGVRIELLCGERAYRYLSATWEQNLKIAQSLSAKPVE
ncbi:MAG: alanyl-tRNA editing protein, partial [Clostridiales bacterium]|nr:alanyl-tRNA editing protein [Clostridiales bacterium]